MLFNNCILPIKEFEIENVSYITDPQEFELNRPYQNIKHVKIDFYSQPVLILISLPAKQTVKLTAKYADQQYEWTYTAQ